jgi:hypothetical protein
MSQSVNRQRLVAERAPLFPPDACSTKPGWIHSNRAGVPLVSGSVPVREIEPPYRVPELDWRAFDRARLIAVLNGIATGPRSSRFRC